MTLALLITAVGGAWAQSYEAKVFDVPASWASDETYLSAADLPKDFVQITNEEAKALAVPDGNVLLIYDFEGENVKALLFMDGTLISEDEAKEVRGTFIQYQTDSNVKICYTAPAVITEWSLTPDETGKKWTLDKMPASNVELQVEYFAESNLFLSKDALADKTNIAVKAGDLGVQFGDDGKSANTVTEGTPMTVTYNGTKKVLGMKVEKKEAAPSLTLTSPEVGQVIGSDGKNYAYGSLPTGVTPVAKICYVSGSNGLALALTDEGAMSWSTAIERCAAHTPAFTGGTWKLATKDEWNSMITAAGSYSALRDGFKSVGGTNMQSDVYRSSTEDGSSNAWYYVFIDEYGDWYADSKEYALYVRACLAF